MLKKIRRQKPIKGGRISLPSCVLDEIYSKVRQLAREYNCSRSFVIATILAEGLGIKKQEKYYVND